MVAWTCTLDGHQYGDYSAFSYFGYEKTNFTSKPDTPAITTTTTTNNNQAESKDEEEPAVRRGRDGRIIYTSVPIDPRVVNPYAYIKDLPPLESLKKRRKRFALPPMTRATPSYCLVLDLDETLVHCSVTQPDGAAFSVEVNTDGKDYTVHVRVRPHFQRFMEVVSKAFEIVVYTASERSYANKIIDMLDPEGRLIKHRLFREHCMLIKGNYVKDLTILRRDLRKTVIVDNSPMAIGYHLDNGIPVDSWYSDTDDRALRNVLPFLEYLVTVDDVRPCIIGKYNLLATLEDFYA